MEKKGIKDFPSLVEDKKYNFSIFPGSGLIRVFLLKYD